jgi:hypothetical protein
MRGHSWNLGECPRVVRRRIAQADGAGDGREVVLERVQERSDVVLTLIGFLFIPGRHCLQAERGRFGVMAVSPDAGARPKPGRLDSISALCCSFVTQWSMDGVYGWTT